MIRNIMMLSLIVLISATSFAQIQVVTETPSGVSARLQHDIDITKDPKLGYVPKNKLVDAYKDKKVKADKKKAFKPNSSTTLSSSGSTSTISAMNSLVDFSWTERGPYTDAVGVSNGNTRAGNGVTAGRVRAVWEDFDGQTIWVGGIDGGLWKTTNIGTNPANWIPINDFFSNMAIASICQDPTDPNILFFGTGEKAANADAVRGAGIWMSTDHGITWNIMANTENFWNVSKVVCDAQGNLYVGCNATNNTSGLQRFTKTTGTWTNITPTGLEARITDLEMSSTGKLHIVCGYLSASTTATGYRYTTVPATVTAGTWTSPTTSFTPTNINVALASKGDTLYALPSDATYNVPSIYKSVDGGKTWAKTATTPAFQSGQAWYNMAVSIDPKNANNVIVGGLDCYKTTNGGGTWTKKSAWVGTTGQYVHADQHIILWNVSNRVIVGSDGGIFLSTDGGETYKDRNVGLRIKQFYAVAVHPTSTNYMLAGAQDNGVHQLNGAGLSSSIEVTGGDGAFVHIDQNQPNYQFGSYVYNNYRRSADGGNTWSSTTASNVGRFINPTDYDDISNILYASYNANTYARWANAQTGATLTSVAMAPLNGGTVSAVKVSPYSSNTVFFGGGAGTSTAPTLIKATNAQATPTFRSIIVPAMAVAGTNISSIELGTDENNIIVAVSNYGVNNIWVTNNGGTSWTTIDGDLPNMPVRWAMFYPGDNTRAIIATETGVWQTTLINGASTLWDPETTFPNVRTDMLQFRTSDGLLAAATHGRGIFTANIPYTPPPCGTVSGLTAASITGTSASLSWAAMTGAVSYDVEYKLSTATTWTRIATATTALSVNLTGLTASSTYNYQVRANCAASVGVFTAATFTTASLCYGTYDITSNNTYTAATAIPLNTNINGRVETSTDIDFFKFVITKTGTATITLTTLPANYSLTLVGTNGSTTLATSNLTGTSNETITNYNFTAVGTYYIKIAGVSKAFNTANCYTLKVTTGTAAAIDPVLNASTANATETDAATVTVKMFPNPAKDLLSLYVVGPNTNRTLTVYNSTGNLIFQKPIQQMLTTLNVKQLSKGVYFVRVNDANGKPVYSDRFMKE